MFSAPTTAVPALIKVYHAGAKIDPSGITHIRENTFATHLPLRASLVRCVVKLAKGIGYQNIQAWSLSTVLLQKASAFAVLLASSVLSVLLVVLILIGIVAVFGLGGTVLVLFLLWTLMLIE